VPRQLRGVASCASLARGGVVVELRNFTGELEQAERFIRAKCALIATDGLSIHIKHTRAKRRDVVGYYRFADRRIVIAVKRRLRYPRRSAYGVGSLPIAQRSAHGRPFKLVWHEDRFDGPDDLLVFVAGHEVWHYLCHSGQRKGDHETKANCNGFAWLHEFRRWSANDRPVDAVPLRPPRPDLPFDQPSRSAAALPTPAHSARRASARNARAGDAATLAWAPHETTLERGADARAAWVQGDLFSSTGGDAAPARRPPPSRPRRARRRETR
jgi:hypothetical protein